MVGDSSVDVQTARNAGIPCCGVTYGFQPETLADPAPDLLIDRMEQLADWLLGPTEIHMNHRPGATVPVSGIYWCTVCKLPQSLYRGPAVPRLPEHVRTRHVAVGRKAGPKNPSRALD